MARNYSEREYDRPAFTDQGDAEIPRKPKRERKPPRVNDMIGSLNPIGGLKRKFLVDAQPYSKQIRRLKDDAERAYPNDTVCSHQVPIELPNGTIETELYLWRTVKRARRTNGKPKPSPTLFTLAEPEVHTCSICGVQAATLTAIMEHKGRVHGRR